jgi:uncharacterized protein YndB with AHSA1/START domain
MCNRLVAYWTGGSGDLCRYATEIPQDADEEDPMTDQIERELLLPAPPEQVWEVVTAPGFLAEEVELDLDPGGEARFADGDDERTGWVEEAVPPDPDETARLTFWWSSDDEPASRVELTLEPGAEGYTRLRVVEARPLEVLDVTGIPLPGTGGGAQRGPAMLAVA